MLSLHTWGKYKGCRMVRGGGSLSLTLAPIDRQVFVPWVLNVQTPSPPVPKRAVYGRTWDVESIGRTYVVTLGDGQWYAARGQQGSVSPGARPGRAPVLREELKAEGRSESWGSAAPTIRRRSLVKLLLDRRRGDGGVNTTQTRVLNALQRQTHHLLTALGRTAVASILTSRSREAALAASAHELEPPIACRATVRTPAPSFSANPHTSPLPEVGSIVALSLVHEPCVLLSSPLSRDGVLSCGLTTPYSPVTTLQPGHT